MKVFDSEDEQVAFAESVAAGTYDYNTYEAGEMGPVG